MSGWVNFRQVKEQVRLVDVIRRYCVRLEASGVGGLRGRCPLPTHSSKDSSLSFSINTVKNAWACHSQSCVAQRGGSLGGNVLDFVAAMEGLTIRGAALLLQEWFGAPQPVGNDDSQGGRLPRRRGQSCTWIPAVWSRSVSLLRRRPWHLPRDCAIVRNRKLFGARILVGQGGDSDSQSCWRFGRIRRPVG